MLWKRSSSSGLDGKDTSRVRSRGESDVEKEMYGMHRSSDNEEDETTPSLASSRNTASSSQAMHHRAYSTTPRSSRVLRLPASLMRWLCLGIAVTMLIFMFSLVRLSWISGEEVKIAIQHDKTTPKPPKWEGFEFLQRYYGGVRELLPRDKIIAEYPTSQDKDITENSTLPEDIAKRAIQSTIQFDPYPNYNSPDYISKYGEKVDCFLDASNTVQIPHVRVFEGIPQGFPKAVMGSAELLGLRNDICYDRFGRLGPYGLGYSLNRGGSGAQQEGEREGADEVWKKYPEVDFREVKWVDAQLRCISANQHRFSELPKSRMDRFQVIKTGSHAKRDEEPSDFVASSAPKGDVGRKSGTDRLPRTAVIIRTWSDYKYTPEDLIYLRSLISELSILSGGEYIVHFLIQVKDNNIQIWSDDAVYERILHDSLPAEFRGMGTLWTERQMLLVYGDLQETMIRGLPVHGVYRSTFMPMQYFAFQHPEFDYFWNWEMDVRTTNHWYHLFESVRNWAKSQPRKYLWERNSRFYVPSVHGSYQDFSTMVRIQTEQGTNSANNLWSGLRAGGANVPGNSKISGERPIWGPERPVDDDVRLEHEPVPPTTFEDDEYTWGVGEEADLITFNPLFDPQGTTWLLADDVTGYNISRSLPPRRTAIITASRLSRKLLLMMHQETSLKRHTMFSEMWPASAALHHGLKAVYVPQAEYIDRKWPTRYLESIFNGGRNGATGGARTSVFGDREHNFRGTTWYYNAGFPEVLWHRWLGMRFNNAGGEQEELAGEGRMCLPGMLLHPIKRVELPQDGRKAE